MSDLLDTNESNSFQKRLQWIGIEGFIFLIILNICFHLSKIPAQPRIYSKLPETDQLRMRTTFF